MWPVPLLFSGGWRSWTPGPSQGTVYPWSSLRARRASYGGLPPHGGVAGLCVAVLRAEPHPDERHPVIEECERTKHREMFKRLPEG